jgi:trehalose/maltose hydrolase-like predicted phosphorylase
LVEVPDFDGIASAITDPSWFLRENDYEPALEHELESRFSVANGFIGIRGSLDLPTEASRPRTYVAGLFDMRPGPPALSALVPAPQAFAIRLSVDGEPLDIGHGVVRQHARLLDYGSGVLRSIWRHELQSGRAVSLESLRFASMATPNLAVQLLRLRFDGPADVSIQMQNPDSSLLSPTDERSVWRTRTGSVALACLQQIRLQADARPPSRWRGLPSAGVSVRCERDLSFLQLTSYGLAEGSQAATAQAQKALRAGKSSGSPGLHKRHVAQWHKRWLVSDVVVDGDEEAQEGLRFAVYHLNSAVDPRTSTA